MGRKETIQKLAEELELKYQAAKKVETEALHNAIAEVIAQNKPDAQTLLFVLEMVRFECLSQKFGELFVQGGRPPLDIKAEQ
jgi:hypothetical protein